MTDESRYFSLSLVSLRALGNWAADCAEQSLPVFETFADSDSRPHDAIYGIRLFADEAIEHVPPEVREILLHLPTREAGNSQ